MNNLYPEQNFELTITQFVEDMLPISNIINMHILSIDEVYTLLKYFVPIIENRGLFGNNLEKYLQKLINSDPYNDISITPLNMEDYKNISKKENDNEKE